MSEFSQGGNRGKNKSHGKYSKNYNVGGQAKEALENCPTIQNFKNYAAKLDHRHDKFERILKFSRDITIESKRIIFLLHTIDRDSKKSTVLSEAETRLEGLVNHQWKSVAKELHNEDPYLFHRAFTSGMQEFMEAFIFFTYLKSESFLHWDHYQQKLKFNFKSINVSPEEKETSMILPPVDYILGLADVTGELMRKCINNLGEGNVEGCFKTCNFVRNLYLGFLMIGLFGNKEMNRKAFTLRQSLLKMEMVCYNIHVRGTESPQHMLADVDSHKTYTDEEDRFFS